MLRNPCGFKAIPKAPQPDNISTSSFQRRARHHKVGTFFVAANQFFLPSSERKYDFFFKKLEKKTKKNGMAPGGEVEDRGETDDCKKGQRVNSRLPLGEWGAGGRGS